MDGICSICGLPKDLCVCQQINNEQRKVYILEKRVKGSKFVTQISGIENVKDAENMFKELKKELACGGTVRDNVIELQGKHRKKLIESLKRKGYDESQIS